MDKREGRQQGPQQHDEGRHGDSTHTSFIEGLHGRHGGSEESDGAPRPGNAEEGETPVAGHHRLFEDREQHDEARKEQ